MNALAGKRDEALFCLFGPVIIQDNRADALAIPELISGFCSGLRVCGTQPRVGYTRFLSGGKNIDSAHRHKIPTRRLICEREGIDGQGPGRESEAASGLFSESVR